MPASFSSTAAIHSLCHPLQVLWQNSLVGAAPYLRDQLFAVITAIYIKLVYIENCFS